MILLGKTDQNKELPEKQESSEIPWRLSKANPDFVALRHYLLTKTHLHGLNRSEKTILRKQSKSFFLREGELMYKGKEDMVVIENPKKRLDILADLHL